MIAKGPKPTIQRAYGLTLVILVLMHLADLGMPSKIKVNFGTLAQKGGGVKAKSQMLITTEFGTFR